jgi:hypothetical protein
MKVLKKSDGYYISYGEYCHEIGPFTTEKLAYEAEEQIANEENSHYIDD